GLSGPDTQVPIERVETSVYTVPTDLPESDGTYTWNSTTMVLVEASAGGVTGLGYSYADPATARLVQTKLADVVTGQDALSVQASWELMVEAIRNLGRPGICSMAISAVDIALWDLKARLLGLPLARLLGQLREGVPVYGSGGFTSYTLEQLADQLGGWVDAGIPRVKMKVGRDPDFDVIRVRTARDRIGPETELFIDANGAYDPRTALFQAERLTPFNVSWFEEPVSSDNLLGLRFMREHAPARMDIAAGEYGYELGYFRRMLESGAVDVQQADATRCSGITGFLQVATLCQAFMTPLSAHCGPTAHLAVCCAAPMLCHLEYFHDHVRIERIFFDGVREPVNGVLFPDLSRPGLGVELKRNDAEKFRVG
ncbi:MAG TPA: enolase C-terminal domain-like protein, partial [Thermomicrobiaceae bacterium]|nr:enolase C-terminal domain-like protein [Thermomicrobiaceae bacterium]